MNKARKVKDIEKDLIKYEKKALGCLKSVHVYCLLSVSVVANTSGFINNKGSFFCLFNSVCMFVTKYNLVSQ